MLTPKKGLWSWLFQRITAIFLVFGLFAHFWAVHYGLRGPLDIVSVRGRLVGPNGNLWQLLDILLLLAAVYHGINGLWGIILDYAPKQTTRKAAGAVLAVLGIVTFIMGIIIFLPMVRGA